MRVVGLALPRRTAVPFLGNRAVGLAVLAVEMEVAQQALGQRVAGLGRRRQPFECKARIARDAQGLDEAAADLGLRAWNAGMAKLCPDGERRLVVSGCRRLGGPRHEPGRAVLGKREARADST
jgi:hypothetical protein